MKRSSLGGSPSELEMGGKEGASFIFSSVGSFIGRGGGEESIFSRAGEREGGRGGHAKKGQVGKRGLRDFLCISSKKKKK